MFGIDFGNHVHDDIFLMFWASNVEAAERSFCVTSIITWYQTHSTLMIIYDKCKLHIMLAQSIQIIKISLHILLSQYFTKKMMFSLNTKWIPSVLQAVNSIFSCYLLTVTSAYHCPSHLWFTRIGIAILRPLGNPSTWITKRL